MTDILLIDERSCMGDSLETLNDNLTSLDMSFSEIASLTAYLEEVTTEVQSLSGDWNRMYEDISSLSANWNEKYEQYLYWSSSKKDPVTLTYDKLVAPEDIAGFGNGIGKSYVTSRYSSNPEWFLGKDRIWLWVREGSKKNLQVAEELPASITDNSLLNQLEFHIVHQQGHVNWTTGNGGENGQNRVDPWRYHVVNGWTEAKPVGWSVGGNNRVSPYYINRNGIVEGPAYVANNPNNAILTFKLKDSTVGDGEYVYYGKNHLLEYSLEGGVITLL